jgi:hypothetical protein
MSDNYGEERAYWYLRLNGFFPLSNFVVHKDEMVQYRADVDLLAIRPPHVFEDIGGQDDDWDPWLRNSFDLTRTLGWICEVKTGAIDDSRLFRQDITDHAVKRLGLVPLADVGGVIDALKAGPAVDCGTTTLAKVLISSEPHAHGPYFNVTLDHMLDFIEARVRRYPHEKFNSRMFFKSTLFQHILHGGHREMRGN